MSKNPENRPEYDVVQDALDTFHHFIERPKDAPPIRDQVAYWMAYIYWRSYYVAQGQNPHPNDTAANARLTWTSFRDYAERALTIVPDLHGEEETQPSTEE